MYVLYVFVCPTCNVVCDYLGDFLVYCPSCQRVRWAEPTMLHEVCLTYKQAMKLLTKGGKK